MSAAGSPLAGADGIIGQRGVAQVFGAARARLGLVALLFGVAAVAWWSTADRMAGMDEGPGTDLGALGWFLGIWVVMMAAMMFPSVAPTVALYARMTRRRAPTGPLLFTAGYVVTWTAAGRGPRALGRRCALGRIRSWCGHSAAQYRRIGPDEDAEPVRLSGKRSVC